MLESFFFRGKRFFQKSDSFFRNGYILENLFHPNLLDYSFLLSIRHSYLKRS